MASTGNGESVRASRRTPAVYELPLDADGIAIALLSAGDRRGAAAEVIRVHGRRLHEYLRALLRDPDVADDAYSLLCEWMLVAVGKWRGESSLRTWAFGVAYNAARRVRDDAFRRRRRTLRSREISELPGHGPTTSSAVRRERAVRRLDELRRHLSEQDQNLLALRVEQRLEWEEIAEVLAAGGEVVTAQALRKRFERLKERIGRIARQMGVFE